MLPVAVNVQYHMRGTDGHRDLVPLVISQAVRENLSVRLLALGAIVKTHLTALAAALKLQKPAESKCQQCASLRICIPCIAQNVLLHKSPIIATKF